MKRCKRVFFKGAFYDTFLQLIQMFNRLTNKHWQITSYLIWLFQNTLIFPIDWVSDDILHQDWGDYESDFDHVQLNREVIFCSCRWVGIGSSIFEELQWFPTGSVEPVNTSDSIVKQIMSEKSRSASWLRKGNFLSITILFFTLVTLSLRFTNDRKFHFIREQVP